ncbi:hypothetical protein KC352_g54 [Hortaea werneckii]|nr:hypothetical protein KC352_g54 [Hortaea werneckii]
MDTIRILRIGPPKEAYHSRLTCTIGWICTVSTAVSFRLLKLIYLITMVAEHGVQNVLPKEMMAMQLGQIDLLMAIPSGHGAMELKTTRRHLRILALASCSP